MLLLHSHAGGPSAPPPPARALPSKQVWFCTQKGYKPWLAPDATNTRTNEQGGQTTWYDEPALLKEVEQRLSRPIPALTPDLSLPPEIASRVAGTQAGSGGGAQYGQQRGGGVSADVSQLHAAACMPVQLLCSAGHASRRSRLTSPPDVHPLACNAGHGARGSGAASSC